MQRPVFIKPTLPESITLDMEEIRLTAYYKYCENNNKDKDLYNWVWAEKSVWDKQWYKLYCTLCDSLCAIFNEYNKYLWSTYAMDCPKSSGLLKYIRTDLKSLGEEYNNITKELCAEMRSRQNKKYFPIFHC